MNFSVVIPTYNREKDLSEIIDSILSQSLLPSEFLIVDDGTLPQIFIERTKTNFQRKGIRFIYYKKDHTKENRGSSESRNISLELITRKILFILDDDLILSQDFFKAIMEVWEENIQEKKLIGVGGVITNNRRKNLIEKFFNKAFGLTSKFAWDINNIGFQVWDEGIIKKEKGYYAHGGVCSYKKSLIKKIGNFSVFSGGRTALEDVDFCLRAKNQGYHFIIEPKAKVIHKQSKVNRENNFLMGIKEGYNRRVIFKKNSQKNIKNYIWFYWSNIGWTLRQFLVGHFSKGTGIMKGMFIRIK